MGPRWRGDDSTKKPENRIPCHVYADPPQGARLQESMSGSEAGRPAAPPSVPKPHLAATSSG